MPFRQDTSYLSIGERTNANGSKAFREAMLEGRWDDCVEIARDQTRDGAHLLDVCVDYVGRDGVADMREVAGRLATASTLPIVLDSTEPAVIEAGLELLGGRAVVNSVNYEDGDGPDVALRPDHAARARARRRRRRADASTRRARPAPRERKVAVAARLIDDLTGEWGMQVEDILVDCLTFPIATGQEETRRDGLETIEAIRELKRRYPDVQTTLGLSNVSFGLNPAARVVLNSVFLHECVKAGLDSAIVHASKILPMARIPDEQREVALDLVYDRRRLDDDPASGTYDPLQRFLELFEGVDAGVGEGRRGPRSWPRCRWPSGCSAASSTASATASRPTSTRRSAPGRALDIVNDTLLDGHEDRRRAVRPGRDAAAVRAAVRRGDEDRGRLPRAAHGEARDDGTRARARSCSPRSRATCTTSARTSSTSS